jgi:hypothetical protein
MRVEGHECPIPTKDDACKKKETSRKKDRKKEW